MRSNNIAGTYKASLIYDWYQIDLLSTLDKCQDDWTIKGEVAAYVCWKEDVVQVDEEVPVVGMDVNTGLPTLDVINQKRDIQTFRAVDVKRIDPHNLYFDKSQVDNWQHCRKIYREFVPIETILANEDYSLTAAEKKELKELVYRTNKGRELNNMYFAKIDEGTTVYGSTVEVLEFEGDYVDPDTYEVFTNVEATVIAGKYLARFAESKKPMSSIIWHPYMKRPDTGRGQSPLRIPEILNTVQNMCADLTLQSWKLNTYPTYMAPKGMLPSYVDLTPGKVVEYDVDLASQGTPQKMDFSSGLRGFDFSDFFQRRMESATGINQYMQGATDGSVRTASEAAYIHSGATTRMAREAHLFSHGFIFKLVRVYSLFKKVFDIYDKEIPVANQEYAIVNEEVRNGDYQFIIGGSQAAVERDAETKKIFTILGLPAFQSLSAIMDPLTASEFLKWILNRMNFQETDQIMQMMNLNGMLKKVASQLGVQENNYEGFRRDMMTQFAQQAPDMAMGMYNDAASQGIIGQ